MRTSSAAVAWAFKGIGFLVPFLGVMVIISGKSDQPSHNEEMRGFEGVTRQVFDFFEGEVEGDAV